jgi:hypothetical protein
MNQISISPSKDHPDREAEFRDCGNEQETCAHPQKGNIDRVYWQAGENAINKIRVPYGRLV